MDLDWRNWHRKQVCVTGGTGFLGRQLVRQLRTMGARVRVLGLRPSAPQLLAEFEKLDCVYADVRDAAAVAQAVGNCDFVFHTAGPVGVWGKALEHMVSVHTEGTRNVVNALPDRARLIHTSSVVTVGASAAGEVLNETASFNLQSLRVEYVHAKRAAEDIALSAAARGKNVVVANPAYLIGPDDLEGSVMGRLCLRFWRNQVPLVPPGGLNFVDVRDVAHGQLLAAERGTSGRRYILGSENLSMLAFAKLLAQARGQSWRWRLPMPRWLYALLALGAETRSHYVGREPYPSRQHVRVSKFLWYYSSARARDELGYHARPVAQALADAHDWFCAAGRLRRVAAALARVAPQPQERSAA